MITGRSNRTAIDGDVRAVAMRSTTDTGTMITICRNRTAIDGDVGAVTKKSSTDARTFASTFCRNRTAIDGDVISVAFRSTTNTGSRISTICCNNAPIDGDIKAGTAISTTNTGISRSMSRNHTTIDGDVRACISRFATDTGCAISTICFELPRLSGLAVDSERVAVARHLNTSVTHVIIINPISRCCQFSTIGKDEMDVTLADGTFRECHVSACNDIPRCFASRTPCNRSGSVLNYGSIDTCGFPLFDSAGRDTIGVIHWVEIIDRLCPQSCARHQKDCEE